MLSTIFVVHRTISLTNSLDQLSAHAAEILQTLCTEIPTRDVGTAGNRRAADYFADTIAGYDFETNRQEFDCLEWVPGSAELSVEGGSFQVEISPYSLECTLHSPLAAVETVASHPEAGARSTPTICQWDGDAPHHASLQPSHANRSAYL